MKKAVDKSDDKHDYMPRLDNDGNPIELTRAKRNQNMTLFKEEPKKEDKKESSSGMFCCFRK